MSVKTILSVYTHTHARAHIERERGTRTLEHTDSTKLTLHNLKRAANRDLRRMESHSFSLSLNVTISRAFDTERVRGEVKIDQPFYKDAAKGK